MPSLSFSFRVLLTSLQLAPVILVSGLFSGDKPRFAESSHNHLKDMKTLNFTHEEVADIMRAEGFNVKVFPGEPPLALVGDVTYLPEQVLPELFGGRMTAIASHKLWKTNGVAASWYFFDTNSAADHKMFQSAVKTWTENTCIQFNKLKSRPCSEKLSHGSICVGNFGGCWSSLGNTYRPGHLPQKISVQPGGCRLVAAAHELGHALGINHQMSRPDRDQFMFVNYENFAVPLDEYKQRHTLGRTWSQGGLCAKSQVVDLPVPYDYMSLMHYSTAAFGDADRRPVFVAADGHYQYMLDYHRNAGFTQTHYDVYGINIVYECEKKWIKSCRRNGKHPPKCKNLGFLNSSCQCECSAGFSGHACQTKVGPLFPLLAKAKTMLEVSKSKNINIGDYDLSDDKLDGVLDDFKYFQFFTIIAHGIDPNTQVSMQVNQSVDRCKGITYRSMEKFLLENLGDKDCEHGIIMMWGLSRLGHLRTECLSSVANNESDGLMLRSKTNHLDLTFHSLLGINFNAAYVTVQITKLSLKVLFSTNPSKVLVVNIKAPVATKVSDTGVSTRFTGSNQRAMRMSGPHAAASIAVVSAMLLLLVVVSAVFHLKRKKKREEMAKCNMPQ